ncbi:phage tail protein [Filimonas effusa]|uniref:Phage tail protein n=1 Tax=Filimonas effusa TaxID=2508721 RepID=A0A4Q1DBS5_9BACT|nr:tail fiber protein [Filimonas effusa]RXK85969.1 phage tail protein [Filimonas effusa]
MEGTIGEIRMFAGNFNPLYWLYCRGQQVDINQYIALYAIVGITYGGDAQTKFNLPSLCSRVPIGAGQGTGLSNYELGEKTGTETVTLTQLQIPSHTHIPTVAVNSVTPSGTVTLYGVNSAGGDNTPVGELLGSDGNTSCYAPATDPTVPMAAGAITVNSFAGPLPTVTVATYGGSTPHNNIQPYTAVNYVICVEGIFPSRN